MHGTRIHTAEFVVGQIGIEYDATGTGKAEPSSVKDIVASI